MTSVERNELAEFRKEVREQITELREEFKPALVFYQRASGVLAVAKWLGPTSLAGAVVGVLWATGVIH